GTRTLDQGSPQCVVSFLKSTPHPASSRRRPYCPRSETLAMGRLFLGRDSQSQDWHRRLLKGEVFQFEGVRIDPRDSALKWKSQEDAGTVRRPDRAVRGSLEVAQRDRAGTTFKLKNGQPTATLRRRAKRDSNPAAVGRRRQVRPGPAIDLSRSGCPLVCASPAQGRGRVNSDPNQSVANGSQKPAL